MADTLTPAGDANMPVHPHRAAIEAGAKVLRQFRDTDLDLYTDKEIVWLVYCSMQATGTIDDALGPYADQFVVEDHAARPRTMDEAPDARPNVERLTGEALSARFRSGEDGDEVSFWENLAANIRAALSQPKDYPTEDAYMRACRAMHWRTAQLRAHGIEPLTLTDGMGHYPPDDYDFGQPKGEVEAMQRVRAAAFDALRKCEVSEEVFAAVASATHAVIAPKERSE